MYDEFKKVWNKITYKSKKVGEVDDFVHPCSKTSFDFEFDYFPNSRSNRIYRSVKTGGTLSFDITLLKKCKQNYKCFTVYKLKVK